MKTIRVMACLFMGLAINTQAQEKTREYREKRQAYVDSIKASTWPYKLPVWGNKIVKRGVDLPYPIGVMLNYVNAEQAVEISDLMVGVNDLAPVPLDFVKFGDVKAKVQGLNVRADAWILPFVDVYGFAGKTWASTTINVVAPIKFSGTTSFNGEIYGAGLTFGGAYKNVFGTIDYNHSWTKFEQISGSIHSQMVTPRIGYIFHFKNHPDQNIGLWVGTSGLFVNRTTEGVIRLSDLNIGGNAGDFDIEGTQWYQNLSPAQQVVFKKLANSIKDKLENVDVSNVTIPYSLNKQATSHWSMNVGGQYQLNHRWQFRTEVGFLGGRSSYLFSTNYRFGF